MLSRIASFTWMLSRYSPTTSSRSSFSDSFIFALFYSVAAFLSSCVYFSSRVSSPSFRMLLQAFSPSFFFSLICPK